MNAQTVEVALLGSDVAPKLFALIQSATPDLRMLSHTGIGKLSTTYSPEELLCLKTAARTPKSASQRERGMAWRPLLSRLLDIMVGM
jgi:hypothetical protein